MRLRWNLGALCLCLCLGPSAKAAESSAEIGARLSQQATSVLEQILGPGRGRALVRVEAESSRGHSDFELTAPAPLDQAAKETTLPGYVPAAGAKQESKRTITSHQVADWDRDMQIKSMHVTAILDSRLDAGAVAEVKRVLPQFLQMDGDRGDDLVVVQAPLRPAWRQALEDPQRWRTPALVALVLLSVLMMVVVIAWSVVRSARALAQALEKRALPPADEPPGFEPLPPLEGEILNGLPAPMSEDSAQAATLALGRRFDFLTGRDPGVVARVLGEMRGEDLAELFAHLAGANPDLSALLFSGLPFPRQSEISQRLAGIRTAEPERLSEIEERLRALVDNAVPGPERLGAILSRLPADKRQLLLADVGSTRPEAVEEVERSVFGFEDLARLSVVDLRRLLSAVPYEEWAIALYEADPAIVRALLAELPPETADAVREGLPTPPSPARVMAARSRVLGMARSMIEGGRVPGGAGLS